MAGSDGRWNEAVPACLELVVTVRVLPIDRRSIVFSPSAETFGILRPNQP